MAAFPLCHSPKWLTQFSLNLPQGASYFCYQGFESQSEEELVAEASKFQARDSSAVAAEWEDEGVIYCIQQLQMPRIKATERT
jgi:hypothetical protein